MIGGVPRVYVWVVTLSSFSTMTVVKFKRAWRPNKQRYIH